MTVEIPPESSRYDFSRSERTAQARVIGGMGSDGKIPPEAWRAHQLRQARDDALAAASPSSSPEFEDMQRRARAIDAIRSRLATLPLEELVLVEDFLNQRMNETGNNLGTYQSGDEVRRA